MISVLIFAVDAKLRRNLEQLPKREADIRIVGIADDQQSFVRLADKSPVDVVLTQEMPTEEQFTSLRVRHKDATWVLFVELRDRTTYSRGFKYWCIRNPTALC